MLGGAIIIACFGIPLTVFAGALLFDRFESFVAAKLADESHCDWADPYCGLTASDLEVFHNGTSNMRCQHDHGARG